MHTELFEFNKELLQLRRLNKKTENVLGSMCDVSVTSKTTLTRTKTSSYENPATAAHAKYASTVDDVLKHALRSTQEYSYDTQNVNFHQNDDELQVST